MQIAQLKNTLFFFFFILLILSLTTCNGFLFLGSDSLQPSDHFDPTVRAVCANNMGECTPSDMGSLGEAKRRALVVHKKYISYETLKRDLVPCRKPGASYYNCRAEANPYGRGCEFITGCARDISDIYS